MEKSLIVFKEPNIYHFPRVIGFRVHCIYYGVFYSDFDSLRKSMNIVIVKYFDLEGELFSTQGNKTKITKKLNF